MAILPDPRVAAMMEDPAVTRPRQPWAISFGPGAVFAGCLITAVVFMALTFVILVLAPEEATADLGSTPRLAMLIGGLAALAFLVIGPTLAFAVGWLLRTVHNQSTHVLVFAVAGAVVGGLLGWSAGGPEVANILAGMVGVSAAVGRLAVSPYARV